MRMTHIAALLLCALLACPALAAEMTPEQFAQRVRELSQRVNDLQKANLVLTEDLARAKLEVDTLKDDLKGALQGRKLDDQRLKDLQAALDKQSAALKALEAKLADQQQQHAKELADEVAARQKVEKLLVDTKADLMKRIDELQRAMAEQNEKNAQLLAQLRDELNKEHEERTAGQQAGSSSTAAVAKQQKKDRTMMYIMGVVLLGAALAK